MALLSLLLSRVSRPALILRAMATLPATSPESISISRVVRVRNVEGEEQLNVIMDDCWGHHHRFLRDKNEHVSKTLHRIVLASVKSQKRQMSATRKRKRPDLEKDAPAPIEATAPIEAHLYTPSGEGVESEVPNKAAWEDGGVLELGSVQYKVCVNLPTILSLKLPRYPMTGCPVVPQVSNGEQC